MSTTFLILTTFSTSAKGMGEVMMKSFAGYGIAFVCAIFVWVGLTDWPIQEPLTLVGRSTMVY